MRTALALLELLARAIISSHCSYASSTLQRSSRMYQQSRLAQLRSRLGAPRPRQVVAQPVSSLVSEKADPSKNMDDSESVRRASSLYEARGPSTKEIKCEELHRLLNEITATGRKYPIATSLSRGEEVHQCQSKVGAVPFGSVHCYHQLKGDKVGVPPTRKQPFVAEADQPQLAASSSQTASEDRNATSESPAIQQPLARSVLPASTFVIYHCRSLLMSLQDRYSIAKP